MLELFPDTAALEGGELAIGGVRASALAGEHGTPLVVYCKNTIRANARAYGVIAGARIVYGTKAFANVALLRLLREERVGADVSTLGELAYARRAGFSGDEIVFHGNNKSDAELAEAAAAGALVVLDALGEAQRAAAAGVERVLVRLTPGVEADTHVSIRTAHEGSKFGLGAADALAAAREARDAGIDAAGLHMHVGSQLLRSDASLVAIDRVVELAQRWAQELGEPPRIANLGGGLGVAQVPGDAAPPIDAFARALVERFREGWARTGLPEPELILEPGRSLVGRAGVTLYQVGVIKRAGATTWVSVDGGMSDNPRPQLYGARYTALIANRADESTGGSYSIAGKHCESGDVLIRDVALPEPRPGDLLAVPATGAYTLSMASNYNGVPRPAAVLVADGRARLIRRRETVEDLLSREVE